MKLNNFKEIPHFAYFLSDIFNVIFSSFESHKYIPFVLSHFDWFNKHFEPFTFFCGRQISEPSLVSLLIQFLDLKESNMHRNAAFGSIIYKRIFHCE